MKGLLANVDAAETAIERPVSRRAMMLTAGAAAAAAVPAVSLLVPSSAKAATTTSFANGISVTDNGNAQHFFDLVSRSTSSLTFPVPIVRPTAPNKNIAFDVMPNGAPGDYYGNGIAWMDVCDRDVQPGDGSVATARIGAYSNHVEFGSRAFGSASPKAVWLTVGSDGSSKPQIRIDAPWGGGPGEVVVGCDGCDVVLGSGLGIATTATRGFVHLAASNGKPTAVPAAFGQTNAMVYDRVNHKLWIYDGGWRGVTLT